MKDVARRWTPG